MMSRKKPRRMVNPGWVIPVVIHTKCFSFLEPNYAARCARVCHLFHTVSEAWDWGNGTIFVSDPMELPNKVARKIINMRLTVPCDLDPEKFANLRGLRIDFSGCQGYRCIDFGDTQGGLILRVPFTEHLESVTIASWPVTDPFIDDLPGLELFTDPVPSLRYLSILCKMFEPTYPAAVMSFITTPNLQELFISPETNLMCYTSEMRGLADLQRVNARLAVNEPDDTPVLELTHLVAHPAPYADSAYKCCTHPTDLNSFLAGASRLEELDFGAFPVGFDEVPTTTDNLVGIRHMTLTILGASRIEGNSTYSDMVDFFSRTLKYQSHPATMDTYNDTIRVAGGNEPDYTPFVWRSHDVA